MKGDENANIGVVSRVGGTPRSSETYTFDGAYTTSYSTLIETMHLTWKPYRVALFAWFYV